MWRMFIASSLVLCEPNQNTRRSSFGRKASLDLPISGLRQFDLVVHDFDEAHLQEFAELVFRDRGQLQPAATDIAERPVELEIVSPVFHLVGPSPAEVEKLEARRIVRAGFHYLIPKTNVETNHGDGRYQDEAKKPPRDNRGFIWGIPIGLLKHVQWSLPVISIVNARILRRTCAKRSDGRSQGPE